MLTILTKIMLRTPKRVEYFVQIMNRELLLLAPLGS
jgi:hypothetical protein